MTFRDQPYHRRRIIGGAMAEKRFAEVHPRSFERFGWDDAGINIGLLPDVLRHIPDYCDTAGLYECKGVGKDQLIKLKLSEVVAYSHWNTVHPLKLFVWDSSKKRYTYVEWDDIVTICNKPAVKVDHFSEGRAYFAVPCEEVFT